MKRSKELVLHVAAILAVIMAVVSVQAQIDQQIKVDPARQMKVVGDNGLYCGGYIQTAPVNTANKIIGAHDEADRWYFAQNDLMFINMGRDRGVNAGDVFTVIRPRGAVKSKWTRKSDLGSWVQEVGALQVVDVKPNYSVARVKTSCDTFMLGDLVAPMDQRFNPVALRSAAVLDRFANSSGKPSGHILMSRDNALVLGRDNIVYVDLGADDRVQVGDKLTIYRDVAWGNVTQLPRGELASSRDYLYRSDIYDGGNFSSQSPRKDGEHAAGGEVTTRDAKRGRPMIRKVVGEAVVLNVREKTATVVITRTGQEIHPGDEVEIQ